MLSLSSKWTATLYAALLALSFSCGGGGGSSGGGGGTTPSFSLSLTSGALSASIPSSGTVNVGSAVQVVPAGGFSGNVTFSLQGAPTGVTGLFTPSVSATTASLQLNVSSAATAGTSTLTVKGSSPGVADANAILTLSLTGSGRIRQPGVAEVEAQYAKVVAQYATKLEQTRAIGAFMATRPEYRTTGVNEEYLTAWGELQNGWLHVVTNNPPPAHVKVPGQEVIPPSESAAGPPTLPPHPLVPPSRVASDSFAAAAGSALPGSSTARFLNAFDPAAVDMSAITDMGGWLKDRGWTILPGNDASVPALKTVGGDGFFYIQCHGGHGKWADNLSQWFCLQSSTLEDKKLSDGDYKADLDAYRLVLYTDQTGSYKTDIFGKDEPIMATWYGFTYAFAEKYWGSFGSNAVVFINACNSGKDTPSTNAFKAICLSKGANVVFGWSQAAAQASALSAARYLVDRCVGANKYNAEYPAQRPFPWDAVLQWMQSKGYETGSNGEHLFAYPKPGLPAALLAPSIRLLEVDEFSGEMKLKGAFGSDQGEVTVDGSPVAVKNWGQEEITCTLPKAASGDVLVKVRSLKSNPRPLTEWSLPLNYTWTMPGGYIKFTTGTANIRYRMDVSGFRKKPGESPTYLRRGTWPVLDSGIPFTGTGNVSPCSLSGGTVTIPTIPSDKSPQTFLQAPLIVDGNTQTGILGLAIGTAPSYSPWMMVCPGAPSSPVLPSFGLLQMPQGFFYQTQAEDAAASVGPIPAMTVTYGTSLELRDGSYSSSSTGALKVEWQNATQKSPPRPSDAGI
jgi:hypothetical protein